MGDLGSRLLEAGLVTRAQLSRALEAGPPHGAALARELSRLGVEEDALAGFFVASGFGPLVSREELFGADPTAVARLAAAIAFGLSALPVRASPAGLVVAMVDPTDAHALSEIQFAVGGAAIPLVARVTELRAALEHHWPNAPRAPLSEAPLPLVRSKTPAAGSRIVAQSFPRRRSTRDFARLEPGPPPPRRERKITEDRWDLPEAGPEITDDPPDNGVRRLRRSLASPVLPAQPPGEIGAVLAGMRAARTRDEVARLACEGAATVGRVAVVLGRARGTLRGIAAYGGGLGSGAVRNLRIPERAESRFRAILEHGEEYLGPHGVSPADTVFRATIGGRGGDVLLVPIVLSGRTAAVLCVDDPSHGERGRERVEVLAHAAGEAFERIIAERKTGA